MITQAQLIEKANKAFPTIPGEDPPVKERNAFMKGYIEAIEDENVVSTDFFKQVAAGLRQLWPPGEKIIKGARRYPWRDSIPNIVKRLEFIWKERNFQNKYSVSDCLLVARKYLAQFESDTTYMQTLKYFVFKQEKLVSSEGKITYTYKSMLADLLADSPILNEDKEIESLLEEDSLFEQGELI